MKKQYIVDTNVLLNDPQSIQTLYNGAENQIFIPYHVLLELDSLKHDHKTRHLATQAIHSLQASQDDVVFLPPNAAAPRFQDRIDTYILNEIKANMAGSLLAEDAILITNDVLFQIEAANSGISTQHYRNIIPFKSESEKYTGFIDADGNNPIQAPPNSFARAANDMLYFYDHPDSPRLIDYDHEIWKLKPKSTYQNAAFELMLAHHIDLISIQSPAGLGKTTIALATAFHQVFQKKRYRSIYITKPTIEIGQPLGFLPGDLYEKLAPYTNYLKTLIQKLHELKPVNRLFLKNSDEYDPDVFELLPINYIRGMNIENAFVIIDECQNLTRLEMRTLLTRLGANTKCVCLGDTNQVDHPYLNSDNNGINWLVKKLKGAPNYGHVTLQGNKSRGPICDLVLERGL